MDTLIGRVKAIIVNPKPTWETIKAETLTVGQIYTGYLVPLALIPAVATFIGFSLVGVSVPFVGVYHYSPAGGLVRAILSFLLVLLGIFIAGKVINALAPSFAAMRNDLNAFKVAAYSWTPALVVGILNIVPALSILVLLGSLYSIYLLYLGLPVLMECPRDRAVGYTIASIVAVIVIYVLITVIIGLATAGFRPTLPGIGR